MLLLKWCGQLSCCSLSATFDQHRCPPRIVSNMRPSPFPSVWGYRYSSVSLTVLDFDFIDWFKARIATLIEFVLMLLLLHHFTHTDRLPHADIVQHISCVAGKRAADFPVKCAAKKRRKKLKSFTLQSITALCVCTFFQSAFSDQSVSCFFMASVFVSFRKHLAGCRRQKPKLVTGYCCWPLVKNRWLLILQFIIIITTTIIIGYVHIARTLPLKLEDMASLNSTLLSDRASQFACKLETHCCCF